METRLTDGRSFTEYEFDVADHHGKTCLAFLAASSYPIAGDHLANLTYNVEKSGSLSASALKAKLTD